MAIANDDYSGMDDDQKYITKAGIERIGRHLIPGDEIGFTLAGCDVCLKSSGGNKHHVGYLVSTGGK
jgi:hypothetical protein